MALRNKRIVRNKGIKNVLGIIMVLRLYREIYIFLKLNNYVGLKYQTSLVDFKIHHQNIDDLTKS